VSEVGYVAYVVKARIENPEDTAIARDSKVTQHMIWCFLCILHHIFNGNRYPVSNRGTVGSDVPCWVHAEAICRGKAQAS
jgi:hypothetical protein